MTKKSKIIKKTRNNPAKQSIKSDFYLILMWISLVGLLTYIATLSPSLIREQFGNIPTGWYGYWIPSALLFATGFSLALRRKKLGAEILIATSLADSILPMILFPQLRNDGPFELIANLVFAATWLVFLRVQPKFLTK